ncbi:MAG TPA: tetratricopeptide repeat protein, partial [Vicinamibacterales bacterium]|nr:tetratricopeptide repeat protein [Vicinamibacterales bacterium]
MRAAVRLLLAATVMASAVALRADEAAVAEIQLQLADLLYADGRYSEALEAYRRAEAAPDAGVKIRAGRGLVLSLLRVGRFDEARRRGGDLAAAAPRDPQVLAVYADALWAAGLFEESERVARDALAVDPALPRARHGLARA